MENRAGATLVSAVARSIGDDPSALLARVNHVRYEVYPGVFRGAATTLKDAAGNDYDRAVLLHDFLAATNPAMPVRYAFCTLSAQQSAGAIAAARAAYSVTNVTGTANALAAEARSPQLRQHFVRIAAWWTKATAQERQQTTALADDFQKAGARIAGASDADLPSIVADHVWIQARIHQKWVDFDPAVSPVKVGASLCAPARTSDSLPDSAFDTVTAVLRLETRDADQEHDATIASGAWHMADLADVPLAFAFAEPSGLHAPAPQPAGMLAYTPLLIAGSGTIVGVPIVVPEPYDGPPPGQSAAAGASAAEAAFGSNPPPAPRASIQPAGPTPVALRLTLSVAAPGVPRVSVERPIFDRISATDRAAGRSATAQLQDVSLYSFGTAWDIAVTLGTGIVGADDRSPLDFKSKDPRAVIHAFGLMHRGYYALRRAVFADTLGPSSGPVFTPQPGVSFLGFAPQAAGIDPFGLAIDRAVEGARPIGGGAEQRLAWAVASVYGERLVVGAAKMVASDNLDTLPFDDVIEMFYIARHASNAPTIVRSSDDVARLHISDDAKTLLAASIAGGSAAVIPSAAVGYGGTNDSGWWILRPNGSLFDEMQSGMHHSSMAVPDPQFVEEAKKVGRAAKNAIWFGKTGSLALCAALLVSGAVMSGEPELIDGAKEVAVAAVEGITKANEIKEAEEAALLCAE